MDKDLLPVQRNNGKKINSVYHLPLLVGHIGPANALSISLSRRCPVKFLLEHCVPIILPWSRCHSMDRTKIANEIRFQKPMKSRPS